MPAGDEMRDNPGRRRRNRHGWYPRRTHHGRDSRDRPAWALRAPGWGHRSRGGTRSSLVQRVRKRDRPLVGGVDRPLGSVAACQAKGTVNGVSVSSVVCAELLASAPAGIPRNRSSEQSSRGRNRLPRFRIRIRRRNTRGAEVRRAVVSRSPPLNTVRRGSRLPESLNALENSSTRLGETVYADSSVG